jgi:hypothetical protein
VRWELWARAICDEVPIVQSNAMVESVWSVLKKRYSRRFNRAKLEFLVDILMNMHIPRTIKRDEAITMLEKILLGKRLYFSNFGIDFLSPNGERNVGN